jgi:hypothetical protein
MRRIRIDVFECLRFIKSDEVRSVAAQDKNPKILVFMGDDIGMWKIGAYHRAR